MPYLKPETLALTILLALITAVGPLATDMYLPVLPVIRQGLGATTAQTQATLSGFLVGYALAQLFYGPVSDRHGRKPAMLFGLALFAMGSLFCALATSIEMLILARVVQALGGAGSVVLARAMVRDCYAGARAGRELARIGTIMALVPAAAPMLGAVVASLFGWRSVFYFMALLGPLMMWVVHKRLPETLKEPLTTRFSPLQMFRDFRGILASADFRFYTLIGALSFAGLFCFLSAGSFVLQGHYGLSERAFAAAFVVPVVGYMIGATISQRKVMIWGIDPMIRAGIVICVPSVLVMLAGVALNIGGPFAVLLPMGLYQIGFGMILSQTNAGAMMRFADRAGSASSLFSVTQMSISAIAGVVIGACLDVTPLALPLGMLICSASMLAVLLLAPRSPKTG